jgi:hypothetical protein
MTRRLCGIRCSPDLPMGAASSRPGAHYSPRYSKLHNLR